MQVVAYDATGNEINNYFIAKKKQWYGWTSYKTYDTHCTYTSPKQFTTLEEAIEYIKHDHNYSYTASIHIVNENIELGIKKPNV